MEWQPIETAPKDETRILVFAGGYIYTVEWLSIDDFAWWFVDDNKHGPFPLNGYASCLLDAFT